MIKGTVTTVFGADINTDDIIRADILQEEWDKDAFARYAFDKFDPAFRARCQKAPSNVVLAEPNFGSGSSREQAVYAIKYNNVAFVVAARDPKTGVAYPDIFYRNAVNNALPLVTLDSLEGLSEGDVLTLDLDAKTVTNATTGHVASFDMPDADLKTIKEGGLVGRAVQDLIARLSK